MIESEQQWEEIQRKQEIGEINGVRSGVAHNMMIKDYCDSHHLSGYTNSGVESESEAINNSKFRRRKHHSHSKSPEASRRQDVAEMKKHIEYRLIDPPEEDKRNISYTRVE